VWVDEAKRGQNTNVVGRVGLPGGNARWTGKVKCDEDVPVGVTMNGWRLARVGGVKRYTANERRLAWVIVVNGINRGRGEREGDDKPTRSNVLDRPVQSPERGCSL
jgi:hypothetical protein